MHTTSDNAEKRHRGESCVDLPSGSIYLGNWTSAPRDRINERGQFFVRSGEAIEVCGATDSRHQLHADTEGGDPADRLVGGHFREVADSLVLGLVPRGDLQRSG